MVGLTHLSAAPVKPADQEERENPYNEDDGCDRRDDVDNVDGDAKIVVHDTAPAPVTTRKRYTTACRQTNITLSECVAFAAARTLAVISVARYGVTTA
jgi:hypothetical protein